MVSIRGEPRLKESLKKDFEINGEQHYVDPKIVESDKRRRSFLEKEGWDIYILRWSEFKRLSEKDRQEEINKVLKFLGI